MRAFGIDRASAVGSINFMNVDEILGALNRHKVSYLLIGGMNFLLRHEPVLTYDVDIWIADDADNRARCEQALVALDAEWGASDKDFCPVRNRKLGWLSNQSVFCLTSPHGAIDVFRSVRGLDDWAACRKRSLSGKTAGGISYRGLGDADMLTTQEALKAKDRKLDRIRVLRDSLAKRRNEN